MTRSRSYIERRLSDALARARQEREGANYVQHAGLAPEWGTAEQKIEDALEAVRMLP